MTNQDGNTADWDDASWLLASSFIVFTMQSGFGMLESGLVSKKNEVNIMVKNAVDVIFGGLSFWMFGYALSFGTDYGNNPFCGVGNFFVDGNVTTSGWLYTKFFFQLSFSTTSTTIVSGAMAERAKLDSYCLFSFINTLIYAFPAHWVWGEKGWLNTMGVVDIAGGSVVHIVGGFTGLVATLLLRPRVGRFSPNYQPEMSSPTNAIVGMFMLWWGWLGFNCGSTLGVTGHLWKLSARAAVTTIMSSMGGGLYGITYSYFAYKKKIKINHMINGVLGSLVSITPSCVVVQVWESIIIGTIGAACSCHGAKLLARLRIDDPVDCVSTHAFSGMWGMIAVGLFCQAEITRNFSVHNGLFYGGGFYLLGVQLLAILSIAVWTVVTSYLLLYTIKKTMGIRLTVEEERLGADAVEHDFGVDDIVIKGSVINMSLSEFARSRVHSTDDVHDSKYGSRENSAIHTTSRPTSGPLRTIKSSRSHHVVSVSPYPHIEYSSVIGHGTPMERLTDKPLNVMYGQSTLPGAISPTPKDEDELSLRSVTSTTDKLERFQRSHAGVIHKGR